MLTLKEFIKKYTGVLCGTTKENHGQCTGVIHLWRENLGLKVFWGHARDLYKNAPTSDWTKIPNSPKVYPVAGDVMCWDATTGGGWGHVAVVTESNADEDSFTVFEQNNPFGSPPKITKYKKWNGVIGWLRPKVLAEQTNDCEKKIKELESALQETTQEKDRYKDEARDSRAKIKELEKIITERETLINNLKEINQDYELKINDLKGINANLSKELDDVVVKHSKAIKDLEKVSLDLVECKATRVSECTLENFVIFIKNKLIDIWNKIKGTKIK